MKPLVITTQRLPVPGFVHRREGQRAIFIFTISSWSASADPWGSASPGEKLVCGVKEEEVMWTGFRTSHILSLCLASKSPGLVNNCFILQCPEVYCISGLLELKKPHGIPTELVSSCSCPGQPEQISLFFFFFFYIHHFDLMVPFLL